VAIHVYSKWVEGEVGKPIGRHQRGHSPKDTAPHPRRPETRACTHHEMPRRHQLLVNHR